MCPGISSGRLFFCSDVGDKQAEDEDKRTESHSYGQILTPVQQQPAGIAITLGGGLLNV